MDSKIEVMIVRGSELSSEYLDIINAARVREFASPYLIKPAPDNEDWSKKYFLVKDGEKLLAFGRLHDVNVNFQNVDYSIVGLASVVALERGKGYGTMLVTAVKNYAEKSELTLVGFCTQYNSPFYIKRGFKIIPHGQKRFYHPTPPRLKDADVLYLSGKDKLIEKMLEYPNEIATLSRTYW